MGNKKWWKIKLMKIKLIRIKKMGNKNDEK